MGDQVSAGSGEVGPGLGHILLLHGDRDIFLLHNAIAARGFVQKHLVILLAVVVQAIALHGHEDRGLQVLLVDPVVVDGDFGSGPAVQRV